MNPFNEVPIVEFRLNNQCYYLFSFISFHETWVTRSFITIFLRINALFSFITLIIDEVSLMQL